MVRIKWRPALLLQIVLLAVPPLILAWYTGKLVEMIDWKTSGQWVLILVAGLATAFVIYKIVRATKWGDVKKHKGIALKIIMGLIAIVLVVWIYRNIDDYWTNVRYEQTRAEAVERANREEYCSENPLDDKCYNKPVLIAATRSGSETIHTPLGRRIEWEPTTYASYAMWYRMGRDTGTVEFPKNKAHKEMPFPLDSIKFISREKTPVTIVLRLK
ncbi:MAG: hypothetical protein ACYCY6_00240 [Minisyncoccota bacterium]